MSNYVPPTTPIGGPQGFPPQQSFSPPPPQKKSNVLTWLVVGCGTIMILGVIAVFLGGYFVWNKAKQAGLDPELMQKQPALAVAKMAAALDSDIEVVTVDEDRGLITFKKKSTGETMTVNVDQAKSGRVIFKQDGKGEMTIEAKGEGEKGSLEVKTNEGTAKFGSSSVDKLPEWLPPYPGVQPEGTYSAQTREGESGGFSFMTPDAPNRVASFYEEGLKRAGMTVNTNVLQQNGKVTGATATGESSDKKQTVLITATSDGNTTRVGVIFDVKK